MFAANRPSGIRKEPCPQVRLLFRFLRVQAQGVPVR